MNTPPPQGTPPDLDRLGASFRKLVEVIARLRSPDGCPWDRKQTLETIKPHTLEETYELLEAIDSGDDEAIVEELGDVLLQVVLDAQIGTDEGRFDLLDVVDVLTEKMIRRHPHVFGDAQAESADDVVRHWDREKKAEKGHRESLLDGVPEALPSLARAARLSDKAARAGYDWPDREMLFDKLREEVGELAHELFPEGRLPEVEATVEAEPTPDCEIENAAARARVEGELGDILFVVANIARRWKINPEEALRRSNRKFEKRFRYIEEQLAAMGKSIDKCTLQELEALYQQGKRAESGGEAQPPRVDVEPRKRAD